MAQGLGESVGACPSCGQHMRLPADLNAQVACPRCTRTARAIELIPQATAISSIATAQQVICDANAPTILQMPAFMIEEAAPQVPPALAETKVGVVRVTSPSATASNYSSVETTDIKGRASRLLDFCAAIDSRLIGWRLRIVFGLIFLAGVGGPVIDKVTSAPTPLWTVLSTNALLLVLWLLLFAWLGSLRDDDGLWSGRLFIRRLAAHVKDLQEAAGNLTRASLGSLLVVIGASVLALRNVGTVIAIAANDSSMLDGFADKLLAAGTISFVLGSLLLIRRFSSRKKPTAIQIQRATAALRIVPGLIDMQETKAAQFGDADPVQVTLSALSDWQQRRNREYDDEYGYQLALKRHFGKYPELRPVRQEVWMSAQRRDGRADFILNDIVLVEVKHHFSKSRADRAIGQMGGYGQTWRGKPKMLVIFDARRDDVFGSLATRQLEGLHEKDGTITVRM